MIRIYIYIHGLLRLNLWEVLRLLLLAVWVMHGQNKSLAAQCRSSTNDDSISGMEKAILLCSIDVLCGFFWLCHLYTKIPHTKPGCHCRLRRATAAACSGNKIYIRISTNTRANNILYVCRNQEKVKIMVHNKHAR